MLKHNLAKISTGSASFLLVKLYFNTGEHNPASKGVWMSVNPVEYTDTPGVIVELLTQGMRKLILPMKRFSSKKWEEVCKNTVIDQKMVDTVLERNGLCCDQTVESLAK